MPPCPGTIVGEVKRADFPYESFFIGGHSSIHWYPPSHRRHRDAAPSTCHHLGGCPAKAPALRIAPSACTRLRVVLSAHEEMIFERALPRRKHTKHATGDRAGAESIFGRARNVYSCHLPSRAPAVNFRHTLGAIIAPLGANVEYPPPLGGCDASVNAQKPRSGGKSPAPRWTELFRTPQTGRTTPRQDRSERSDHSALAVWSPSPILRCIRVRFQRPSQQLVK